MGAVMKPRSFQHRISLCSPGCPGTCSVDQAGLECQVLLPLPPSTKIKSSGHYSYLVLWAFISLLIPSLALEMNLLCVE